ncbi:glycosyltransferase family A protein [Lentisphaera marina]|uniref:glycosyltransferase family A protein n=1 Tax=Lentisphaera marina TaxID=1111041 RepID=UPI002366F1DA|nr:glycosyltransferase family A protein [Lentisphaera marina]MDD7986893.1 glycosyltransferase family A protein [Lentisphaera marina]
MSKPLITFAILTYNQEEYVKEAVQGALNQDYDNLEIIISDDSSTDDTFRIISDQIKKYNGPHEVIINRNDKNLGLTPHINKVIYDLAKGKYLILAAGDDIAFNSRAGRSWEILKSNPNTTLLAFEAENIGTKNEKLETLPTSTNIKTIELKDYISSTEFHLHGATRIIKRSSITQFPPLNDDCPTEDSTLLLRCLLLGSCIHSQEKIISYRIHPESLSSPKNIKQLSIYKIHAQYQTDIQYAYEVKLIDYTTKRKLENYFNRKLQRHLIFSNIRENKIKFSFKLLLCTYFSVREKLSILKKTFLTS